MMSRYDHRFSVAILDIDHFKQVNDQQGHLHGDRILQDFARLLDDSVRDTDMVARYGSEEFVVVMPNTTLEGAAGIFSERLRELVQERLPLTISAGLATAGKGDSPQTLLSRADSALYSAKAAGRNRVFRHDGVDIDPITPENSLSGGVESLDSARVALTESGAAAKGNESPLDAASLACVGESTADYSTAR